MAAAGESERHEGWRGRWRRAAEGVPSLVELVAISVAGTAIGARGVDVVRPSHVHEVLLVLGAAGGAVVLLSLLWMLVTALLWPRARGGVARGVLMTALATALYFWFAADAIFYDMSAAHLSGEILELLVVAEMHGEAGSNRTGLFFLDVALFIATVAGALAFGAFLAARGLPSLAQRSARWGGALLGVSVAVFVGVFGGLPGDAYREGAHKYVLASAAFADRSPTPGLPNAPEGRWDAARERWVKCAARRVAELAASRAAEPGLAERRPDIFFFHVEGLRADMLSPQVMPRVFRALAPDMVVLPRHFSTGTQSSSGTYGLVSGLPSYLYSPARSVNLKPLPLAWLARLGYAQHLWATTPLVYDGLRGFFEPHAKFHHTPHRTDLAKGDAVVRAEADMMRSLAKDLGVDADARARGLTPPPRFDYVNVYTTHYDYYYPDEHAVFGPSVPLGFEIWSGHAPMRRLEPQLYNRYRNSVHYADALLGDFLDALVRRGRWGDSVVVITGDHGEEFWELGRFGHTHGLNRFQTQVATVVHLPGAPALHAPVSSHADLFPTVFDWMGLAARDASGAVPGLGGRSLLRPAPPFPAVTVSAGRYGSKPARSHMRVTRAFKLELLDVRALEGVRLFDLRDVAMEAARVPAEELAEALAGLVKEAEAGAARCKAGR